LVRDPIADDYEIETKLNFAPFANFQGAGLVVRQHSENAVVISRGFCDLCVDHGIYFDNVIADAGFDSVPVPLPAGTDTVNLRIRHFDGTYTGSYSLDGSTWIEIASRDRVLSNPTVGIQTGQSLSDPVPTAHFDCFEQRRL
jgi:beta-xylosidase